jgi:hypothetical protein
MNDSTDILRDPRVLDTTLDRYFNQTQPDSTDTDPVLNSLVATEHGITPTATTQARIWQEVLTAHDRQPHLQPQIARFPQIGPYRQHYQLLSVTAAALLIVLIAAIWSNGTKPASAAAILAQAARVRTDPVGAGVKSYQGIVVGEMHSYRPDTGINGRATKWKAFFWFQAPNLARSEFYQDCLCIVRPNRKPFTGVVAPLSTGAPDMDLFSLSGSDGLSNWYYDAKSNTGTWTDSTSDGDFDKIVYLQSLLENVGQEADRVQLAGTETLLGRAVYVLDIKIKPQGGAYYPFTHKRLKIDQQSLIVLAEEDLDDKGQPYYKWEMVSLDLNVPVDPTLFTFMLPPAAVMTDWRTTDDQAELLKAWQTAADQVEFPLYRFTDIPADMKLTRASRNVDAGVRSTYGGVAFEQRMKAKNGTDAVIMIEGAHNIVIGAEEKLTVGPYTAYYQELAGQDQVRLRVDMGTTQVNLMAWPAEISKDELIKLAASLEKVRP